MAVKGLIGVSAAEMARFSEFWASFVGLGCPEGTVVEVARGANIAENRNILSRRALDLGAEWIWYVDDDHIFSPDTLLRLLAADKDIVSGLYLSRDFPYKPHVYDREDGKGKVAARLLAPTDSGLVKVLATGAGALLVKTKVLGAMVEPYWTLGQIEPNHWGDDLDFCRRARTLGFEVWCDLDVLIGHKIIGTIWPEKTAQGWVTTLISGVIPIAHFPAPQSPLTAGTVRGVVVPR